jgi:DNA repair protein SbcD/Mre11
MRVLHTSDWHLGRSFHGASLIADQERALAAIVELVRAEGVDVVIVAGDLYDRQLPPIDAVNLLSGALQELRGAGAAVVAIAGNHDSGRRLGFAQGLLDRTGVHLRGDVAAAGTPVVIPDPEGGPDLVVYPIPYLEPEVARHQLGAPALRSHDRLLTHALDRARADLAGRGAVRSIAVAHAFVSGGTPSDSERVLGVGGLDRVGLPALAGFSYVALGHLHGRQSLDGGRVRYAGSPLAYSFSERAQVKGVWLLDLPADGSAPRVEAADLGVGRPLAVLRGPLEDLLVRPEHAGDEGSWVAATLTDQELPRDAMARLRRRFPHAVTLVHEPPVAPGAPGATYAERVRVPGDLELVERFVEHVTGARLDDAARDTCQAVLAEVAADEAA